MCNIKIGKVTSKESHSNFMSTLDRESNLYRQQGIGADDWFYGEIAGSKTEDTNL